MEQLKILVVDDEARMRKLVSDFLKKNGYQVIEAADGSEALDIFFEQQDIALIILDVMMPAYSFSQSASLYRSSIALFPVSILFKNKSLLKYLLVNILDLLSTTILLIASSTLKGIQKKSVS